MIVRAQLKPAVKAYYHELCHTIVHMRYYFYSIFFYFYSYRVFQKNKNKKIKNGNIFIGVPRCAMPCHSHAVPWPCRGCAHLPRPGHRCQRLHHGLACPLFLAETVSAAGVRWCSPKCLCAQLGRPVQRLQPRHPKHPLARHREAPADALQSRLPPALRGCC